MLCKYHIGATPYTAKWIFSSICSNFLWTEIASLALSMYVCICMMAAFVGHRLSFKTENIFQMELYCAVVYSSMYLPADSVVSCIALWK